MYQMRLISRYQANECTEMCLLLISGTIGTMLTVLVPFVEWRHRHHHQVSEKQLITPCG